MFQLPLIILHWYILASIVTFIGVQLLKYFEVSAPNWIFFYLNDFLAIPIVATFSLHVVWVVKKDYRLRLSSVSIFSLVALYSFYFEYYLPQISPRYTGDFWDVVCYAAGGLVFYGLQKIERPLN